MQTEFEATFLNIDKDKMREQLKKAGAVLVRPEFLQKRYTLNLPKGHEIENGWLRVRDEGDKTTMSLKAVFGGGKKIGDQKEIDLEIDDFEKGRQILEEIGCKTVSFQESKRELWKLNEVEITIDEWPFLEPLVEIEGSNEKQVKKIAEKLNFDYSQAEFNSADAFYAKKYNLDLDFVNNKIPRIVFDEKNPFIKK
ncbi:MAG: CYTH domain-containing protein [Patescibacteria group bacterium]